jgi:hypothetical protein
MEQSPTENVFFSKSNSILTPAVQLLGIVLEIMPLATDSDNAISSWTANCSCHTINEYNVYVMNAYLIFVMSVNEKDARTQTVQPFPRKIASY